MREYAERYKTPEARARRAAQTRERRKRPEVRARARITDAEYRAKNPEKRRSYSQTEKYRKHYRDRIKTPEGRERNRIVQANRRARIRHGQDGSFTQTEWEAIKAAFGDSCAYCLTTGVPLEIEHMQPLVNGGAHSRDNIVPACSTCNKSKHRRDLLQFLAHSTGAAA